MSQASQIRKLALNILKNDSFEKEKISDDSNIKGIRYSVFKKIILEEKNYSFTEGAVVSTLNSLHTKLENIYKTKTSKGVYFYYSPDGKKDIEETEHMATLITQSHEFNQLENQAEDLSRNIANILLNTSKNIYINTSDLDIEFLRRILSVSNQLKLVIQEYSEEKSFELISQRNSSYDLPF